MSDQIPVAPRYIQDFEQLGFGMFVHFGLYSQLNCGEWTYQTHKRDMGEYARLADTFCIKEGAMERLVAVAKAAGCKYITLTTRHHEGFSLYDTRGLNTFDAVHTPTGRDLVAEFVDACRKADILPFFYHTTLDWHDPDFQNDFGKYLKYLNASVELLCTRYGKIGGMWFDGNWSRPNDDWKENELYGMIRRLQPDAVIINNTGLHARGAVGNEQIDAVTYERGMPHPVDRRGMKKYVAGEMCQTLCDHWGSADDINFKPVRQLIEELCQCRKVGANFLLNIGPSGDGSVSKMQEATMECIGRWMEYFGRAIYNGRPYIICPDSRDFVLQDACDPKTAYIFKFDLGQGSSEENVILNFGGESVIEISGFDRRVKSIQWMDNGEQLQFRQEEDRLSAHFTGFIYGTSYCVRVAEVTFF